MKKNEKAIPLIKKFSAKEDFVERPSNKEQSTPKISRPSFTPERASLLQVYLNWSIKWNAIMFYSQFNQTLTGINFWINNLEEGLVAKEDWTSAIEKLSVQVNKQIDVLYPTLEGGQRPVKMDSEYIKEFKNHLLELPELNLADFQSSEQDLDTVGQLVSDIKDEVKKGNRVSFKLIQELQTKIEELLTFSTEKDKETVVDSIKDFEGKTEHFVNLAIEAVDSFDLIYEAAKKANLLEWAEQIEEKLNRFISTLDSFGIEEIKAKGEFIDNEIMISIGTVPQEFSPTLERYKVYSVHGRGFRYKHNRKLVREAKVTTIY
ncbi:nucleotide exchange factor GrpE [Litchfieldia alkalitelluris]|uniref:nucleotide exchange factor GrpE n=1 Tax=Litchfieldia alkalitelluris TaxID=304268 RepID=UPI000997DD0B|nr:nucleotide exchange factor GrpE [Litchfieldia alkalitelluris]